MNRSLFMVAGALLLGSGETPLLGTTAQAVAPALSSARGANPAAPLLETLPSGATLALRPDRLAPRVAISVLVRAGASDETAQNAGWRRLLGEAMLRGVQHKGQTLSSVGLAREAERLGGIAGLSVGDDCVEVFVTGNSENQRELAQLALDIALHARLSDADVDAARKQIAQSVQNSTQNISARAIQSLEGQLYRNSRGEPAAYGLTLTGTPQSVGALTGEKLRLLHTQYFGLARMVVGAAGDTDHGALRAVFGAGSGVAPQDTGTQPGLIRPKAGTPPIVVRQLPAQDSYVVVGFAGAGVSSADAPALRIAMAALTESRTARLPARLIRGDRNNGLPKGAAAYEVQGQWTPRRYASEIAIFAQTDAPNVPATQNAILDEVKRLRESGLSPSELDAAKQFARGNYAVQNEALRDRAFNAALWPLLGASPSSDWSSRLNAVTAADVKRVAIKYLDTHAIALVVPEADDEG